MDYLEESVYPQLSGKKLDRLLLYYNIARECLHCGAQMKVMHSWLRGFKVIERIFFLSSRSAQTSMFISKC